MLGDPSGDSARRFAAFAATLAAALKL
jgi:hypothetical protein